MLTYRVQPRVFKFDNHVLPKLPATAEVTFHLAPDQPFGCAAGGGRTAVQNVAATAHFNANTGQHHIQSKQPLSPLRVEIPSEVEAVSLTGTALRVHRTISALPELRNLVESVYYAFPLVLAPDFGDPPLVTRVDGTIGEVPFRWELQEWQMNYSITTQAHQEGFIVKAWSRLQLLSGPENRRLLAALHYFHVACRLSRTSACPGEFLSEALLNYSKILEVLFQGSRDVARGELAALGFTSEEIERDFISVMVIRSKIDVAHVSLVIFTPQHLRILHRYADRAETAFRKLLRVLLGRLEAGTLALPPYELRGADEDLDSTIQRLGKQLEALGDRP